MIARTGCRSATTVSVVTTGAEEIRRSPSGTCGGRRGWRVDPERAEVVLGDAMVSMLRDDLGGVDGAALAAPRALRHGFRFARRDARTRADD